MKSCAFRCTLGFSARGLLTEHSSWQSSLSLLSLSSASTVRNLDVMQSCRLKISVFYILGKEWGMRLACITPVAEQR